MKILEALGVPKDIELVADQIRDRIFSTLKSSDFKVENDNEKGAIIFVIPSIDIEISDLKVSDLGIELHLYPLPSNYSSTSYENIRLVGASYNYTASELKIKNKKAYNIIDKSGGKIILSLMVNSEFNFENFIRFFLNNKITVTIAHELMHIYDQNKRTKLSLYNLSDYEAYTNMNSILDIDILNSFFYMLYFMHSTECVVRPAEIYKDLLNNNISKSNFEKFLKSNKSYKTILEAKNFKIDNFIKKIKSSKAVEDLIEVLKSEFKFRSTGDLAIDLLKFNLAKLKADISSNYQRDIIKKIINNLDEESSELYIEFEKSRANLFNKEISDLLFDKEELERKIRLSNNKDDIEEFENEKNKIQEIINNVKEMENKLNLEGENLNIFKFKEEKYNKFLRDLENKLKSKDSIMSFYRDIEKDLNKRGEETLRKIARLFELIPEDRESVLKHMSLNKKISSRSNTSENYKYLVNFNKFETFI